MTHHVRTGYRNHRKAAWGLALLFVAAVAAITIPLASGATRQKTLKFVPQPPPVYAEERAGDAGRRLGRRLPGQSEAELASGPDALPHGVRGPERFDNFTFSGLASPNRRTTARRRAWTWKDVSPQVGTRRRVSTPSPRRSGPLDPVKSNPVRVAEFVCPPSCDNTVATLEQPEPPGKLKIADTFGGPVRSTSRPTFPFLGL